MGTDVQLALPWGKDAPARAAGRRREAELSDQLRHRDRRIYRLMRDLREARAIAEDLREDLAGVTRERDELARDLNRLRLKQPVSAEEIRPWAFGRHART